MNTKRRFRFPLVIPFIIIVLMLAQWLFFYDTPLQVNKENWVETEAQIIRLEDANHLKDDAKGRLFFRNQIAVVSYTNEKGETSEGYIYEYDRHFDRIFYPEGSTISILYNKDTGAPSRLWYAVIFRYAFLIMFILIVFIGIRLIIKRVRKTF